MKYILAISLVSILALTSCFEKKAPEPVIDSMNITTEDVLMEEPITVIVPDDTIMQDEAMTSDEMATASGTEVEVQVDTMTEEISVVSEDEIQVIEEDLEALFQDILGE